MSNNRYPIIAKEGWLILAVLLVIGVALVSEYTLLETLPIWVLMGILVYLFRDPQRAIPASPLAVVSPIDGVVEDVSKAHDHWLDRPAQRVKIRTNYSSTFAIRSPLEGKLVRNWCSEPVTLGHTGKIYRHSFWVKSDEQDDVLTAVYVSKVPSRLRFYAHPGMRVGQGQRCGYLYLGGVVEIYLPEDANITVSEGDRVLSGSGVLGKLNTHQPIMTEYAHS